MEYIKCGSCKCYYTIEDIGRRKSGISYKCCKKCRNKLKDDTEPETDNKKPVNNIIYDNMPDKMIVEGEEYVLTKKTINKTRRDEYMMSKYGELNPDINENIVYPNNLSSFTYTSPLKMTEEQMEKMGIKIRSDLDNNISVNNNITDINMTGVLEEYNKLTAPIS